MTGIYIQRYFEKLFSKRGSPELPGKMPDSLQKGEPLRMDVVKVVLLLVVLLLGSLIAVVLLRGMPGRYQAVALQGDDKGILILDTAQGHTWHWFSRGLFTRTFYQGQVRPGRKTGEMIIETE
jgi:hypothetical protein